MLSKKCFHKDLLGRLNQSNDNTIQRYIITINTYDSRFNTYCMFSAPTTKKAYNSFTISVYFIVIFFGLKSLLNLIKLFITHDSLNLTSRFIVKHIKAISFMCPFNRIDNKQVYTVHKFVLKTRLN